MFGFLLGLAAGTALVCNRSGVTRSIARLIVVGEDVVVTASVQAQRTAARLREDLEDVVAEARESSRS